MRVAIVLLLAALAIFCVHLSLPAPPLPRPEPIAHGRFDSVILYRPVGEARSFVLYLSRKSGWGSEEDRAARALARQGALVAGIDLGRFIATMEKDGDACQFAGGDLENLAHYVQGYVQMPAYYAPLLAGQGDGAAMVYAMLAQVPRNTFAGAFSLGFCPSFAMNKPFCAGQGLRMAAAGQGMSLSPGKPLQTPWSVIQPATATGCDAKAAQAFGAQVIDAGGDGLDEMVEAYDALAEHPIVSGAAPPELGKLPIVEVKAQGSGDTMAVLLSGDGGWAGIDKELAAALSAKGIPVAGFDSLRYFWTPRTPEGLAADLERVLAYYPQHWSKPRVLLIGYSQGADVLPFAWNQFKPDTRAKVGKLVLLGLGQKAAFEFHVGNWVSAVDDGKPIQPEAQRLDAAITLCLYGEGEKDSLCPKLDGHVTPLALPGGHHFSGAYDKMAQLILDHSR